MNAQNDGNKLVSGSMELEPLPSSRLVVLRFTAPTNLTGSHGQALVLALKRVRGEGLENFGLLADCKGANATDATLRKGCQGCWRPAQPDSCEVAVMSPIDSSSETT